MKSPEERFWEKVDICGPDECWEWIACQSDRRGWFSLNGRAENAYRVAWKFIYGNIPPGMCVCHHCDNPSCVNPRHLFLGTKADNSHDMAEKGRQARGEKVATKLTENDVLEIIGLVEASGLLQREIAEKYNVSRPHISDILSGRRWGWLTGIQEKNPRVGLTESDVLEIVKLDSAGGPSQKEIAEMYDIDQSNVSRILSGKSWGWLTGIGEEP